jgi:hypothetical protein
MNKPESAEAILVVKDKAVKLKSPKKDPPTIPAKNLHR